MDVPSSNRRFGLFLMLFPLPHLLIDAQLVAALILHIGSEKQPSKGHRD